MDNNLLLKPGSETTEYKVARRMGQGAMVVQGIAATLAAIAPQSQWAAIVIAISGAIMGIAGALGYQVPRAGVKSAALELQLRSLPPQKTDIPIRTLTTVPHKMDPAE